MTGDLLYSKNKLLKHLKNLDKIKKQTPVAPVLARIDLTNACNHRCVYCMYQKSLPEFGLCNDFSFNDAIPLNEAKRLIKGLKNWGVKAIMLSGGGEPTIYPEIKEIIKYILKNDFELGMITNGAKLDHSWVSLLKKKNFKWIRISLDASNLETWKKIHNSSNFNDFTKIVNFVRDIKKLNKIETKIGASFVINDLNYREIVKFTSLCKKNEFDNVRISFTYQTKREKLYENKKDQILFCLNGAKRLEENNFFVNILKSRLESIERKEKNYDQCYFPFFSISIGANMKAYPCCMTKYAKSFEILDFKKENINKNLLIKLNEKLNQIIVKKCPTCWYDSFNEACNYYTKPVDFENFIN